MPPEQNAMPWEQEIIRLKQQLAEAQQRLAELVTATLELNQAQYALRQERDTLRGELAEVQVQTVRDANRLMDAANQNAQERNALGAECQTLRGLLRGTMQVLKRIQLSSIEEHNCGRDDSPCRVCAITHLVEQECDRITYTLKEVG